MQDPRAFMALENAVEHTIQPFQDRLQQGHRGRYPTKRARRGADAGHDLPMNRGRHNEGTSLSDGDSAGLTGTRPSCRLSQLARSEGVEERYSPCEAGGPGAVWVRQGYRTYHQPSFLVLTEARSPTRVESLTPSTALDRKLVELLKVATPTPAAREQRLRVLCNLEMTLARVGLHVEAYGSSITGVTTVNSDLDCVMMRREGCVLAVGGAGRGEGAAARVECALQSVDQEGAISTGQYKKSVAAGVRAVSTVMRRTHQFINILSLAHAKVPIVKCVHRDTRISVDLSFAREGLLSSDFLCKEYMRPGNEMARALTVLVKTTVSNSGLGDPSQGGLGSFPIALMVLFFLQTEVSERYPPELRCNVAVLLCRFLRYYGKEFDFRRCGIDYVQRTSFEKQPAQNLYIINPIRPEANCAKAAERYATAIVPFFSQAADKLYGLLDMYASESRIEEVLGDLFQNVVLTYGDWFHVREAAKGYRRVPQHLWDSKTNMYTGGLVDNLP